MESRKTFFSEEKKQKTFVPLGAQAPTRSGNAWLALLCIWGIFVVHGIDRSVLLVLLEPIRRSFALNDSQLGLLTGLGYAVPFALAGIPLGALADRLRRTRYLAALLALWSGLTALGGLAPGFLWLVLARACVGASEAGAPPTMLSLLGDLFSDKTRPAALSIYYTAPFVGLMTGATLAGQISQAYGWRTALFAIGLPGLLLALAVLAMREPPRGTFASPAATAKPPMSIRAALRLTWQTPSLRRLMAALVLGGFVTLALSTWTPALLQRAYGLSQKQSGMLTALALGLTGILGSLFGGAIAARLGRGDAVRLKRLCALAIFLSVPLAVVAPLMPTPSLAMLCLGIWAFIGSAYLGPGWGVFIAQAPLPARGTIMALAIVLTNLLGAGLGPQSVGLLSDALAHFHDAAHLAHAMSLLSATSLITVWLFLR